MSSGAKHSMNSEIWGLGSPAGESGTDGRGTVGTDAPTGPVSVEAAGVITLRWALFFAMVSCGVAVAVTGRWNGVALLQVVFLLAFFATYRNFRAGAAWILGRTTADH